MRMLFVALLTLTPLFAAAPPALLTPEQVAQLRERDERWKEGLAAWKNDKREQAVKKLEEVLAIERRTFGSWHRSVDNTASYLAAMAEKSEAWRPALALRLTILEVRERLYGPGHWRVVDARLALEEARRQPGRTARQREQIAEAFRLNQQALGLFGRDEHEESLLLFRKALELRKQAHGERHTHIAESLNNLGAIQYAMRDLKAALPLYQQALTLNRELLGERHPSYAQSLRNLADLYKDLRQPRSALALYLRALPLTRDLLGEGHPVHVHALKQLAGVYLDLDDYAAAIPLYRQAVALVEQRTGERHPDYVNALQKLALACQLSEDNRTALLLYRRLLVLTRTTLGPRHPDHLVSLNNLGALYFLTGDYGSALPLLKQALALTRDLKGEKHSGYIVVLNNMANLYYKMGDNKAALPLARRAVALALEVLGEKHPTYAASLNNLGAICQQLGDHDSALAHYSRALAHTGTVLGETHPNYAIGLYNLAGAHAQRGDYVAALHLGQRALALRKEVLGARHPLYAQSLTALASLHARMNRPGTALLLQEQALSIARHTLGRLAHAQAERQQLATADYLRYHLDGRLSLLEESASFSHQHVLHWKGMAFAAQRGRREFARLQGDPAVRALAAELLTVTRELALLSSQADPRARKRLEELTALKDEKEGRLADLSESFRASKAPITGERLQSVIPEGVVVVDLLAYKGLDPSRPAKGQTTEARLAAWVLRPGRPTVRVELGLIEPIESAITSWRTRLEKGESAEEAALLRDRVWRPIEKHLTGAKIVLLSPDGALGRLPFAALPGSKAGTYLLEEVPLAFLPVPRLLPELLKPAGGRASLLTLGGVDFDAALKGKRREKEKHDLSWAALPGTAPEAEAVAARFKEAKASLSGKDGTKAAVREALTRHRYAHLATHGYFAPASMRSALERTDERHDSLFQREGVSGWHPGLLSGLVLAGANHPTEVDDGVLTALEIAEMDLSNLELAVLSACETGLGKVAAGEGILGLQRAFAVAGAKSVVSSLWSVHDAATSVLMERFYHHLWEQKRGKLDALRLAQLDVLRHPEWVEARVKKLAAAGLLVRGIGKAAAALPKGERQSPPAWWAAWQLSGDWR